jgi:sugar/nucleoside kinase (ribokinase family)
MDIIGIGGAFIDLTYHVTDDRLAELGLQKAGISFVTPERQRVLIEANREALTGISHGGSVANSIYTAQKMGAQCAFASKIGNDSYGESFAAELAKHGVTIASKLCVGDTNSVLAFITPDREKTFAVSPELAGTLTLQDINSALLASSSWVLIEGQLFSYGETSRQAALDCVAFAREKKRKLALNLGSISVVERSREKFRELLKAHSITLLIGNTDELALLYGSSDTDAALSWAEKHVEYVVATKGADGAVGRNGGSHYDVSPPAISDVIDTSGAGDAFLGTLLACIANKQPLLSAMERATEVAGNVVRQHGARLHS